MRIQIIEGLEQVSEKDWDALIGKDNPFVSHAFLHLLEISKSVGVGTGWLPAHLLVWDNDLLVGAAPMYLKTDSYGEYIFDWSWANVAAQVGLPYYPKLVVAVPFTPATGPRLLVHPKAEKTIVWKALADGLRQSVDELGAQSLHLLFTMEEEAEFLEAHDFIRRATFQFHWRNDNYCNFEDFLSKLQSRSRKQIRRERRRIEELEVDVSLKKGSELTEQEWEALYALYDSTSKRKWGKAYLTKAFFEQAKDRVGEMALIGLARWQGDIVAGALGFQKGRHLYGRYWGCFEQFDGLHFELCYYAFIRYAIENKLSLVEAGAQGGHKLKRGFLPMVTHSGHFFSRKDLHQAFLRVCQEEETFVRQDIEEAQKNGPFREDSLPPYRCSAGLNLDSPKEED